MTYKELLNLVTFKEYATLMGAYLEWHPNKEPLYAKPRVRCVRGR